MIGAIRGNVSYSQSATRAGGTTPVASASTSASAGLPELAEQVTELVESNGEAAEAILQAQLSVFKETLDMGKSMASGVLQTLKGMDAIQAAQVRSDRASRSRIHLVA
jgi:hypothetical protein